MMTGMSSMSTGSAYGSVSSSGMGVGYVGGGVSGGVGGGMSMGGGMMGGGMMGGMAMGSSTSTVLTIRAKKSDVDAFAGNMMMLGDFQQKVKILMY
jgi:hypothetical protein